MTETQAGTRTFAYDGSLPRLRLDRFVGAADPYWFERHYDAYDPLGNLAQARVRSLPGDLDFDESFSYDTRNRLASWTVDGATRPYAYDRLGNLVLHEGEAQTFDAPGRPHAVGTARDGAVTYSHDEDGNVRAIVGGGSTRYYRFDSANRLVCVDSVADGCGISRIHYDVDGRRVLADQPGNLAFVGYVSEDVWVEQGLPQETRIVVTAFGERIALKRTTAPLHTLAAVPVALPPWGLPLLLGGGLAALLAVAARRGAFALAQERPGYAAVSGVVVVSLVVLPVPPARAGGGGGTTITWELADRLGTSVVMVDEAGARLVQRRTTPFGREDAAAGPGTWLPRFYAGHLDDEDAKLVYMQARWMDPVSGTFLSVDPLVDDVSNPQSINAYRYGGNNPVSAIDPTGMSQMDCFGACAGYYWTYSVAGSLSLSYVTFAPSFAVPALVVDLGELGVIRFDSGSDANVGFEDGIETLTVHPSAAGPSSGYEDGILTFYVYGNVVSEGVVQIAQDSTLFHETVAGQRGDFRSELNRAIDEETARLRRAEQREEVGRISQIIGAIAERGAEELPLPPKLRSGISLGGQAIQIWGGMEEANGQIKARDVRENLDYLEQLK